MRKLRAGVTAIVGVIALVVGALALPAQAGTEPAGVQASAPTPVVPGNDPDNPATPSVQAVVEEVAPGEQVTISVAVQLPDGNVRIDTREARGPEQAVTEIEQAAELPDVVAADVAQPLQALAGDPYRLEIVTPSGGLYPGQFGLTMMCTDADALVLNSNCTGFSYQYATGAGQVIAVLDEPVQAGHPDLAANTDPAVTCQTDPCSAASYSAATAAMHGTHVAGIAAAVTDNGIGIAGQAKGARILPISVLDKGGTGTTTDLARGIAYATSAGVDVMNMSVGALGDDLAVRAAVNAALDANIPLVAAAGNFGPGSATVYPAAYPGVIGVGAVIQDYSVWDSSSRGPWVDVVAPGAPFILATWPSEDECRDIGGNLITTGYCYMAGTSMASPFVAGAVAQIREVNDALTPTQISELITSTAYPLGTGIPNDDYGYGFIDLVKALQQVPRTPSAPRSLSAAPGDGVVTVGFAPPAQTFGFPVLRYEYSLDGGAWVTAGGGRTESPVSITGLTNGVEYSVRLRAVTSEGAGAESAALLVRPEVPVSSQFVAIEPFRAYDSRWAASGSTSGLVLGPLANSTVTPEGRLVPVRDSRSAQDGAVVSAGVVPAGATAVAYNLTATGQTTDGFLSMSPGQVVSAPNSSVLNWTSPRQVRANGYITAIDDVGQVRVHAGGGGTTQFVVDVVGYYTPVVASVGASERVSAAVTAISDQAVFVPLESPTRVYDARWQNVPGVVTGPISGPEARVVSVKDGRASSGSGGVADGGSVLPDKQDVVPEGATGIAYNLTITGSSGAGFLAVAPGDQAQQPAVSTINWSPGLTAANATSGKISAEREIKVFAASGAGGGQTSFIVDVVGYFIPAAALPVGVDGADFVALPPLRAYDSRSSTPGGPLSGDPVTGGVGEGRTTSAGLDQAVPAGASAVPFNLTITGNTGTGFVEVTPGGVASSGTSTINWTIPNTTVANGSIGGISGLREQTSYVGGRNATQYLIDIAGYYTPSGT